MIKRVAVWERIYVYKKGNNLQGGYTSRKGSDQLLLFWKDFFISHKGEGKVIFVWAAASVKHPMCNLLCDKIIPIEKVYWGERCISTHKAILHFFCCMIKKDFHAACFVRRRARNIFLESKLGCSNCTEIKDNGIFFKEKGITVVEAKEGGKCFTIENQDIFHQVQCTLNNKKMSQNYQYLYTELTSS